MAGNAKRIRSELASLTTTPPPHCSITLPSDADIHTWRITLLGPPSTPFERGTFQLSLVLPPDYPFKPPVLTFLTKIYHPNVSNDDKGTMCLGVLRPDVWKPSSRVREVLEMVVERMREPDVEDAVEGGIAQEVRADRKGWEKTAREWVGKYAKG